MRTLLSTFCIALLTLGSLAQDAPVVIPLWPEGAPGFEDRKDESEQAEAYWVKNVHNPSLTVFLPSAEKATGTAVIICPGGGHRLLVFGAEGVDPAKYLQERGIACFVLKYRLGREENSPYTIDVHAKQDAHRAMRLVRSRAQEWGIDPGKVGMLGFSAGGETVSLVAYESGDGDPQAKDPIDRLNGKPDFQMLVYPGPLGIPETIPADAPPALLIVANDDRGASRVIASLFQGYRDAKASVEAHIFAKGGHGFNMGQRTKLHSVRDWPQRMTDWLHDSGYLNMAE